LLAKYEWTGEQSEVALSDDTAATAPLQKHTYKPGSSTKGKSYHEQKDTTHARKNGNSDHVRDKSRRKGRSANHNRKLAHSKKMSKGFGSSQE
jgi:hypothetical protein